MKKSVEKKGANSLFKIGLVGSLFSILTLIFAFIAEPKVFKFNFYTSSVDLSFYIDIACYVIAILLFVTVLILSAVQLKKSGLDYMVLIELIISLVITIIMLLGSNWIEALIALVQHNVNFQTDYNTFINAEYKILISGIVSAAFIIFNIIAIKVYKTKSVNESNNKISEPLNHNNLKTEPKNLNLDEETSNAIGSSTQEVVKDSNLRNEEMAKDDIGDTAIESNNKKEEGSKKNIFDSMSSFWNKGIQQKLIIIFVCLLVTGGVVGGTYITIGSSTRNNISETSNNETGNNTSSDKDDGKTVLSDVNDLETTIKKDFDERIKVLETEYNDLKAKTDTFDKYTQNKSEVEAYYKKISTTSNDMCTKMRQYALATANNIVNSDDSSDDKYDKLDDIYDYIYDGAGDTVYDEIYDGVLDDMYDLFYDGVLDDAYDTIEYSDWSDAKSDEYDLWSDTKSDVYDDWSDAKSDIYDFWSDLKSKIYDDDMSGAKERITKFETSITKLSDK